MLIDESYGFKSWSKLRKQIEALLCDSLKGKVTYFFTSYREAYEKGGRATINYNKRELIAFSWPTGFAQREDMEKQYEKMGDIPSPLVDFEGNMQAYRAARDTLFREKWMPECFLRDYDFVRSVTIYLNTDITSALHSDNYLLRIFAYMDRRVGKRTLVKIKEEAEKLPEWVRQFYDLRCEAERIHFSVA